MRRVILILTGIAIAIGLPLMSPAPSTANNRTQALLAAAERGDLADVKAALASGAELDGRNGRWQTALLVATHGNHVDVARHLIEAGADVNAKDSINDSPYLFAGARGHLDILRLTLSHGADLKSTNRFGGTALIPAAERGHVETVDTLIKAGVAVDHVNYLGWTALLEAIILGNGGPRHTAIVKLLIDAGADVNLADKDGVTPLQHAHKAGYADMIRLLEDAKAK